LNDKNYQTRPVRERERILGLAGLANEKKRALAVGHGFNADRTECRLSRMEYMAAMPTRAIRLYHHLTVWHGYQSSRSAFRRFGIPTRSRWPRPHNLSISY